MINSIFFSGLILFLGIIILILYWYRPSKTVDYANQQLNQQLLNQQLTENKKQQNTTLLNETAYRFMQEQAIPSSLPTPQYRRKAFTLILGCVLFFLAISYYALTNRWQTVTQLNMPIKTKVISQNQNEDMILSIQRKIRENPNQGENWYELGLAYAQNNEFDNALESYSRATILLGRQPQILAAAATALYYQHNQKLTTQAQQWLQEALQQDPDDTTALLLLANDAFQQAHYQQAIKLWQQILDSQRKVDRKLLINMMDMTEKKAKLQ
ncbi:tetratricopeptide repeat protein [Gallibacterium trehalosifermentans]|uniref:Tetratricopeptide repeat protein n=1 Tax=Gallibacterium trehalosifermentans TaxID=516935 RepID=A0ABV6H1W1_9PAST